MTKHMLQHFIWSDSTHYEIFIYDDKKQQVTRNIFIIKDGVDQ